MSPGMSRSKIANLRALCPNDLPVRMSSGVFFRQTSPKYRATDLPAKANGEGRNHEDGREPPMYTSSTMDASWGQLFRHHTQVDVPTCEIHKPISALAMADLPVLDLTDEDVRAQLGVTEA